MRTFPMLILAFVLSSVTAKAAPSTCADLFGHETALQTVSGTAIYREKAGDAMTREVKMELFARTEFQDALIESNRGARGAGTIEDGQIVRVTLDGLPFEFALPKEIDLASLRDDSQFAQSKLLESTYAPDGRGLYQARTLGLYNGKSLLIERDSMAAGNGYQSKFKFHVSKSEKGVIHISGLTVLQDIHARDGTGGRAFYELEFKHDFKLAGIGPSALARELTSLIEIDRTKMNAAIMDVSEKEFHKDLSADERVVVKKAVAVLSKLKASDSHFTQYGISGAKITAVQNALAKIAVFSKMPEEKLNGTLRLAVGLAGIVPEATFLNATHVLAWAMASERGMTDPVRNWFYSGAYLLKADHLRLETITKIDELAGPSLEKYSTTVMTETLTKLRWPAADFEFLAHLRDQYLGSKDDAHREVIANLGLKFVNDRSTYFRPNITSDEIRSVFGSVVISRKDEVLLSFAKFFGQPAGLAPVREKLEAVVQANNHADWIRTASSAPGFIEAGRALQF